MVNRQKIVELVRACRDGDNSAWHQLIDLLAPIVFSICRKAQLSRDEGFDIYGQVCYELLTSIHSLKSPEKILSFTATITRRRIYRLYRSMQILDNMDESVIRDLHGESPESPDDIYNEIRRRDIIVDAIGQLQEKDRQLLTALFLDPNRPSYKEISAKLGMPVPSIGPTRAKALEKLHKILKRMKFEM